MITGPHILLLVIGFLLGSASTIFALFAFIRWGRW